MKTAKADGRMDIIQKTNEIGALNSKISFL